MKKTIILVDGQNLYFLLKDLALLERNILWNKLFRHFLTDSDELIRAYWFRPQKIHDSYLTPEFIRNQIVHKRFKNYYQAYKSKELFKIPRHIQDDIDSKSKVVEDWIKTQKKSFSTIEYRYDQLCLENSDIEIVKKGIVKIDPFRQVFIGEKGVDIALAVKMISLSVEKKCDKIILVSGDYDYIEAINYVKNNMTKIHIVKIHKGIPPQNKNMSRELSVMADKMIDIYESDLKMHFIKNPVVV